MHLLPEASDILDRTDKNRIVVTEMVQFEVKATSVILHVSVKGSSYFTGDAAIKKAKEVSALIDNLKESGITENDIRLKNVAAEAQSGIIAKTSSARYHLTINCADLEKLSEILMVVTAAKNNELHNLDWQFADDRVNKLEQLTKAFTDTRETAECIAKALGVTLDGVHSCRFEDFVIPDSGYVPGTPQVRSSAQYDQMSMARVAAPQLPTGHWQKRGIRAHAVFLVK